MLDAMLVKARTKTGDSFALEIRATESTELFDPGLVHYIRGKTLQEVFPGYYKSKAAKKKRTRKAK